MCGLVGIVDNSKIGIADPDLELFYVLMHLNSLRGMDSAGVMVPGEKPAWIKSTKFPALLFKDYDFKKFLNTKVKGQPFVFGHCRSATKGSINANNAHPFTVGDITLMKNGTINVPFMKDKDFYDWPVDSMWAAHCLNTQTPQDFINMVDGGYAMIWHDKKTRTINFMRNTERPLFFVNVTRKDKTLDQTWIASEIEFLKFVSSRYNLTMGKPYYFDDHTHYFIDDTDSTFDLKQRKLKLKPKDAPKKQTPLVITDKRAPKVTIFSHTFKDKTYTKNAEVVMTPLTWSKLTNPDSKHPLPMFKIEGWLEDDDMGDGPQVSLYMEYEENTIEDITRIRGKLNHIARPDGQDGIEFFIHSPFVETKQDVSV